MKCILGRKLGMTQIFEEDGTVVPVTRVQAGPCVVTQKKTKDKDGTDAVQIGFEETKLFRLTKSEQGHLKGLSPLRVLQELRIGAGETAIQRGDIITVKTFAPGDHVDVIGWSKGKGFQGVVKRHGFGGGPRTHGHKDNLRMPGTIGAGGVQRVFKNVRMGGHMGAERVTVKNIHIVRVIPEENVVFLKGAIPGARGGIVILTSLEGTLQIEKQEPVREEQRVTKTQEPEITNEAKS